MGVLATILVIAGILALLRRQDLWGVGLIIGRVLVGRRGQHLLTNGNLMADSWVRAYQPARARWGVIAWEAPGLAYLHWTTTRLFDLGTPVSVPLAVLLFVAWAAGSRQVLRMGVYLGEHAVQLRGIVRTRTIPWAGIDRVSVDDVVHRVGPLRIPAGRTVVLDLRDGARVTTAMWQRGLDFHRRPQLFEEVCRELRDRAWRRSTGRRVWSG